MIYLAIEKKWELKISFFFSDCDVAFERSKRTEWNASVDDVAMYGMGLCASDGSERSFVWF